MLSCAGRLRRHADIATLRHAYATILLFGFILMIARPLRRLYAITPPPLRVLRMRCCRDVLRQTLRFVAATARYFDHDISLFARQCHAQRTF